MRLIYPLNSMKIRVILGMFFILRITFFYVIYFGLHVLLPWFDYPGTKRTAIKQFNKYVHLTDHINKPEICPLTIPYSTLSSY